MKNYYPKEDEDRQTDIGKLYSHPFDRELYNQPVKRVGWFTRFIRRWFTENCEECNQELLQVGYNGKKKCFNHYCPMFDRVI
jgi:hypothetical protein